MSVQRYQQCDLRKISELAPACLCGTRAGDLKHSQFCNLRATKYVLGHSALAGILKTQSLVSFVTDRQARDGCSTLSISPHGTCRVCEEFSARPPSQPASNNYARQKNTDHHHHHHHHHHHQSSPSPDCCASWRGIWESCRAPWCQETDEIPASWGFHHRPTIITICITI